jgi:hypothetical protein
VHRLGIGHRANGRKSSASRGPRSALDGFGKLLAGLAQVAMQVDESRSDDQTGCIENLGAFRRESGADPHDFFGVDQNIQCAFGAAGGIDDPPVLNQKHAIPLLGAVRRLPAH